MKFGLQNMPKKNMKISYDPDADVLTWESHSSRKIDYATENGNLVVHFTKENIPVLVEVLEASKVLKKSEQVIHRASIIREK